MNLIYSGQDKPILGGHSIFLAGCSPRKGQTLLWRHEALAILREIGYEGTVVIPEPESGEPWLDYMNVVEWEDKYLKLADVVVFWLPRSIKNEIYGFTSNVEFGRYIESGKVIYGRPKDSDNNRYLDYWYKELYQYDPFDNLEALITSSLNHTFLFKSIEISQIKHYHIDDPEMMGDYTVDFMVGGKYVYKGEDWYHDKVENKIEGFLDCLKQLGIKHEIVKTSIADENW